MKSFNENTNKSSARVDKQKKKLVESPVKESQATKKVIKTDKKKME